jgi:hypothetical protein
MMSAPSSGELTTSSNSAPSASASFHSASSLRTCRSRSVVKSNRVATLAYFSYVSESSSPSANGGISTTRIPECRITYAASSSECELAIGTDTPPRAHVAYAAAQYSIPAVAASPTRSPFRTSSAFNSSATRAASAITSAYVASPSPAAFAVAVASGAARARSRIASHAPIAVARSSRARARVVVVAARAPLARAVARAAVVAVAVVVVARAPSTHRRHARRPTPIRGVAIARADDAAVVVVVVVVDARVVRARRARRALPPRGRRDRPTDRPTRDCLPSA